MLLDETMNFCQAAACNTGAAGSSYQLGETGDTYDLGATPGDIGVDAQLYFVVVVTTGITVASSTGQIRIWLASDAAAAFTAGTATRHAGCVFNTSTTAIPAGTVLLCAPIPCQGATYERYLGVVQDTVTTAINAGAINAFVTPTPQRWMAYPDGVPNPA